MGSTSSRRNSRKEKGDITGRGKGGEITPKDKAILDLKNARDYLKKYQNKVSSTMKVTKIDFSIQLQADGDRILKRAKELADSGKKDRAVLVLKLRK